MLGSKPVQFPMEEVSKLQYDGSTLLTDGSSCRRLVGKLKYLTITRPEISFAVTTLRQFKNTPYKEHYSAAVRVLRYLKSAPGQGLFYSAEPDIKLNAFFDSDWAA